MKINHILMAILSILVIIVFVLYFVINLRTIELDKKINEFKHLQDSLHNIGSFQNNSILPTIPNNATQQAPVDNPYKNAEIKSEIIKTQGNTYGYDIILNGSVFIHQPNIPGLPGNKGFSSIDKAEKVADFVINKIRNNIMPPSITMDELNKLNVLK